MDRIIQPVAKKPCCVDPRNLGKFPGKDGRIVASALTCKVCKARHYTINPRG